MSDNETNMTDTIRHDEANNDDRKKNIDSIVVMNIMIFIEIERIIHILYVSYIVAYTYCVLIILVFCFFR